jgi:hypothetical protein
MRLVNGEAECGEQPLATRSAASRASADCRARLYAYPEYKILSRA